MKKVLIGLGTNLGSKVENLNKAIEMITTNIGVVSATSSIYQTPPWGFDSEEYFLNQVIEIETKYSPIELLDELKRIESYMGRLQREKGQGYQDRIIDLDILDYAGEVFDLDRVTIPHPKISERIFVLLPLKELNENWIDPISEKSVLDFINELGNNIDIKKI